MKIKTAQLFNKYFFFLFRVACFYIMKTNHSDVNKYLKRLYNMGANHNITSRRWLNEWTTLPLYSCHAVYTQTFSSNKQTLGLSWSTHAPTHTIIQANIQFPICGNKCKVCSIFGLILTLTKTRPVRTPPAAPPPRQTRKEKGVRGRGWRRLSLLPSLPYRERDVVALRHYEDAPHCADTQWQQNI